MRLRRFYRKGTKYPYYIPDEKIAEYEETGEKEIEFLDNAEYDILLTKDEQPTWYLDSLIRVYNNPRQYLDDLDLISTFLVGWNNYGKNYMKNKCTTCGKEYGLKKTPIECCGKKSFKLVHYGVGYYK